MATTDRAAVNQSAQIGVEATHGVSVAAPNGLSRLVLDMNPQLEMLQYFAGGRLMPQKSLANMEWTAGKYQGAGAFREAVYPLSGVLGAATITVPVGGTTSHQWDWDIPLTAVGLDPKSFTVEQGDSASRAQKASYVQFADFTVKADRKTDVDITGSYFAQAWSDGITMTATPTLLPSRPMVPKMWTLYRDPTSGAIGTTALTRAYSFQAAYGPLWTPHWTGNRANASFATVLPVKPKADVSVVLMADTTGMTPLPDARAGTIEYYRFEVIGDLIEASISYKFTLDFAAMVSKGGDLKPGDDAIQVTWPLVIVEDPTWGKAGHITVINTAAAL